MATVKIQSKVIRRLSAFALLMYVLHLEYGLVYVGYILCTTYSMLHAVQANSLFYFESVVPSVPTADLSKLGVSNVQTVALVVQERQS